MSPAFALACLAMECRLDARSSRQGPVGHPCTPFAPLDAGFRSGALGSIMKPKMPLTDLAGPGRQRVANVLAIFAFSRPTLYRKLQKGEFPPPDGRDGRRPYWSNETIWNHLNAGASPPTEVEASVVR